MRSHGSSGHRHHRLRRAGVVGALGRRARGPRAAPLRPPGRGGRRDRGRHPAAPRRRRRRPRSRCVDAARRRRSSPVGSTSAPELYADERHASVQASRPDRDTTELAIARATPGADLPVLGICRGMQVMAVAAGGTARAARARPRGPRRALARAGDVRQPRRAHRRRDPAGRDPRRGGRRAELPPPVGARPTPATTPSAWARRRHARGDGGPGRRLPPRGPVAPRGRHRPAPLRALVEAAVSRRRRPSSSPARLTACASAYAVWAPRLRRVWDRDGRVHDPDGMVSRGVSRALR